MTETSQYQTLSSVEQFQGHVFSVRTDQVRMSNGAIAARDVVVHPGAVAVVALDEDGRIVLVRQYRHPIGRFLDELPAGLLDIDGEAPNIAAARELAEEARLAAGEWRTLVDLHTSPGGSDEAVRVFLARGLSPADPAAGFVVEDEELQITIERVDLDEAVRRCLSGDITNGIAVAGIMAAASARDTGAVLRPADAPWARGPRP
jgi:8-oxo-dGTP pyrophosphatase MutT (NUDIX family)